MKWLSVLAIFLLLIMLFGWRVFSDSDHLLINPYVLGVSVEEKNTVGLTSSEVSISCVLTYGTFMLNQQECDELSAYEDSSSGDFSVMSCAVESGTFLISERECALLRRAKGSRDVMNRVDQ
jgi:hypothetical protein